VTIIQIKIIYFQRILIAAIIEKLFDDFDFGYFDYYIYLDEDI